MLTKMHTTPITLRDRERYFYQLIYLHQIRVCQLIVIFDRCLWKSPQAYLDMHILLLSIISISGKIIFQKEIIFYTYASQPWHHNRYISGPLLPQLHPILIPFSNSHSSPPGTFNTPSQDSGPQWVPLPTTPPLELSCILYFLFFSYSLELPLPPKSFFFIS